MTGESFCAAQNFQQSRADARREKLIETARALFLANGFHATGIAEIARKSGIAVGQIYRDFASKEEIVAEIVARDCTLFLGSSTLHEAIDAGDVATVREWIASFVEPEDDDNGASLFAEIIAESARNARIAQIFDTVHGDVRRNMLEALAVVLPPSTSVACRETLADTIMTISFGMLHNQLIGRNSNDDVVTALKNIVDAEIRRTAASPESGS